MYIRNKIAVFDAMVCLSKNNELLASYEEIASKAQLPRRTVARAITELVDSGYIKRTHAKGRGITNIYHIEKPPTPKEK